MTALTEVYDFLAAGLRDDPLLCLAQTVAWLDPFWQGSSDDEPYDEDWLSEALEVTRGHFPGIYALAVEGLHHGATGADLERLICAEISALGFPLDSLEGIGYGIPLPAYGTVLHEPDFYAEHPEVGPVMRLFGIQPEGDYPIDIPEHAQAAAHCLMDSLLGQPDPGYQQVGWLMGWLFSCTGNSCIDLDPESLWEFEPMAWEAENLAFAADMVQEAEGILADAQAGLALVVASPQIQQVLRNHIRRLYRWLTRHSGKEHIQQALRDHIRRLYRWLAGHSGKEQHSHDRPRLQWPASDSGLAGTAESDP